MSKQNNILLIVGAVLLFLFFGRKKAQGQSTTPVQSMPSTYPPIKPETKGGGGRFDGGGATGSWLRNRIVGQQQSTPFSQPDPNPISPLAEIVQLPSNNGTTLFDRPILIDPIVGRNNVDYSAVVSPASNMTANMEFDTIIESGVVQSPSASISDSTECC